MIVNVFEEKALDLRIARRYRLAETGKTLGSTTNIVRGGNARRKDPLLGGFEQVRSQRVQNALESLVEFQLFACAGMRGVHLIVDLAKKRYFLAQRPYIEKLGFQSVVEIGGVVRDFIHPVDELCLERRAQIEKVFGKLRKFRAGIIARMLDDALAHFEGEIQSGKIEIALFELFDDAQRVQIVIEIATVRAHQFVKLSLAGVAEGRMANVVNESESFGELGVQAQSGSDGARDLRDFKSVRQAVAKVVRIERGENLRLGFETPEGSRVNDAVAISRISAAVGMVRLRVAPSTGISRAHGPRSRGGNSFDGRLRKFPPDLLDPLLRDGFTSRLGRKRVQPAIGCFRNGAIREFFFDLLVEAGGVLRLGSAKQGCELQQ